jgi:uncharacterized coiled-coil protein SlyX
LETKDAVKRIETAEDLERIVAEQTATITALGTLVRGMDQRIRLQQELLDTMYAALVAAGLAPARPREDPLAIN